MGMIANCLLYVPVSPFHCRIRWASDCPWLRASSGRSTTTRPLSGKVIFVFYLPVAIVSYLRVPAFPPIDSADSCNSATGCERSDEGQSHRVIIAVIISIFLHYPSVGCRLRYRASTDTVVRTRPFIKTMTPFSVSKRNWCPLTRHNLLLVSLIDTIGMIISYLIFSPGCSHLGISE